MQKQNKTKQTKNNNNNNNKFPYPYMFLCKVGFILWIKQCFHYATTYNWFSYISLCILNEVG